MFRVVHHSYYVYIVTNINKTVLYTGVTNNLEQRLTEHFLSNSTKKTFASKYNCYYLVYYEHFQYILNAIAREKEIKGWTRDKKNHLIEMMNPAWNFLNKEFCKEWPPSKGFIRDE